MRAELGRKVVVAAGGSLFATGAHEDHQDALIDTLANIMHFARAEKLDFDTALHNAQMHFHAEAVEPDDIALDFTAVQMRKLEQEAERSGVKSPMQIRYENRLAVEAVESAITHLESARYWLSKAGPGPLEQMAVCDNCGYTCGVSELNDIKHYSERVDDDGLEPAGECPQCGCLAYVREVGAE